MLALPYYKKGTPDYKRTHKPAILAYHKKYRDNNKLKIQVQTAIYRKTNGKKIRDWHKNKRMEVKLIIFKHYSAGIPKCACCSEKLVEFLTLDHINGDGNKHRKILGRADKFYPWVIANNFPKDFQVLCMNCNWGSRWNHICPHKNSK